MQKKSSRWYKTNEYAYNLKMRRYLNIGAVSRRVKAGTYTDLDIIWLAHRIRVMEAQVQRNREVLSAMYRVGEF